MSTTLRGLSTLVAPATAIQLPTFGLSEDQVRKAYTFMTDGLGANKYESIEYVLEQFDAEDEEGMLIIDGENDCLFDNYLSDSRTTVRYDLGEPKLPECFYVVQYEYLNEAGRNLVVDTLEKLGYSFPMPQVARRNLLDYPYLVCYTARQSILFSSEERTAVPSVTLERLLALAEEKEANKLEAIYIDYSGVSHLPHRIWGIDRLCYVLKDRGHVLTGEEAFTLCRFIIGEHSTLRITKEGGQVRLVTILPECDTGAPHAARFTKADSIDDILEAANKLVAS